MDELEGGESCGPPGSGIAVLVKEGNMSVCGVQDAVVGDGHTVDIWGYIFQCCDAVLKSLTVDDPRDFPYLWRGEIKKGSICEGFSELGSEYLREGFYVDKELF
jgi:hypothetical protein